MTSPGLLRAAFARALQPHLLLLGIAAAALPSALAVLPLWRFIAARLDHALGARELARGLDSAALVDLARALGDGPHALTVPGGLLAAALVGLLVGPVPAGAALAASRSRQPLPFRALLAGSGEHYGRLLRTLLVALVPLGVAALGASLAAKLAGGAAARAVTEAAARRAGLVAAGVTAALLFLAQLTLDAGRAHFAVQPQRRSALLAWAAGARLLVRRPLRALALGLLSVAVAAGGGLLAMAVRQGLDRRASGPYMIRAFVLSQLAVAFVVWGRSARLIGLAELAERDQAARARQRAGIHEG